MILFTKKISIFYSLCVIVKHRSAPGLKKLLRIYLKGIIIKLVFLFIPDDRSPIVATTIHVNKRAINLIFILNLANVLNQQKWMNNNKVKFKFLLT